MGQAKQAMVISDLFIYCVCLTYLPGGGGWRAAPRATHRHRSDAWVPARDLATYKPSKVEPKNVLKKGSPQKQKKLEIALKPGSLEFTNHRMYRPKRSSKRDPHNNSKT